MKVILFHVMALTYPHSCAMKNHVDIIRVIAIGILAGGDGGGSSSRQYGISANVDRRKWRKYKALMAFGGCIDSLVRLRVLIDRKCCINTYVAATNPHRTRIVRNNPGLCWNSIHFNESHIIQFNAHSPIHRCFHCRINMFRVAAISREYITRYAAFCTERSHFDDRFPTIGSLNCQLFIQFFP